MKFNLLSILVVLLMATVALCQEDVIVDYLLFYNYIYDDIVGNFLE